jgi:DNA ligase-1
MYDRREWLMLAQMGGEDLPQGYMISEKLDGVRAFWDGGASRGHTFVPYSNDHRPATGLWTRYGNVVLAPDWWLDKLPRIPLDGELWLGHNSFQQTVSIVRGQGDWTNIRFRVFDSPNMETVLQDGQINNPNDKRILSRKMLDWWRNKGASSLVPHGATFCIVYDLLKDRYDDVVEQTTDYSILESLGEDRRVEGYMLRHPMSTWTPKRTNTLIKVKPIKHSTATVQYVTGGKGKHSGRIGSMNVVDDTTGATFDISGFTDDERRVPETLKSGERYAYYKGQRMNYKYRELTDDGKPKEARFNGWGKR